MQTQVKTWGNSQGVRINKDILTTAGMAVDDMIEIKALDGMIILTKPFRHKTLEERAAEYGGELGLDGESDWSSPVGREIW